MKTKTLPTKLSDLLELAVKDSTTVLRKKNFKEDQGAWYCKSGRTCYVCMAGAIMANTLKLAPAKSIFDMPDGYNNDARALNSVNAMREGRFTVAYELANNCFVPTGLSDSQYVTLKEVSWLVSSNFSESRGRAPWATYRKAVKILREAGL